MQPVRLTSRRNTDDHPIENLFLFIDGIDRDLSRAAGACCCASGNNGSSCLSNLAGHLVAFTDLSGARSRPTYAVSAQPARGIPIISIGDRIVGTQPIDMVQPTIHPGDADASTWMGLRHCMAGPQVARAQQQSSVIGPRLFRRVSLGQTVCRSFRRCSGHAWRPIRGPW